MKYLALIALVGCTAPTDVEITAYEGMAFAVFQDFGGTVTSSQTWHVYSSGDTILSIVAPPCELPVSSTGLLATNDCEIETGYRYEAGPGAYILDGDTLSVLVSLRNQGVSAQAGSWSFDGEVIR